jgi:hypothetical protein
MNMPTNQSVTVPAGWKTWTLRCSSAACKRKRLMPLFSRNYVGIYAGKSWFCGPDCFESFLYNAITEATSVRQVQEPRQARRMPLGLLLVSRGVLTSDQLSVVRNKQTNEGMNLGEAVQQLGLATAEQVTAAVAAQWACPVFPLAGRALTLPVRIPRPLLAQYEMLPVHFLEAEKRLTIAFVSRVQYQVLSTIESVTGFDAVPCFITADQYRRYLPPEASSTQDNEIIFDRPAPASEIAKLSRNYVTQLDAIEVRFGICRDYLWMRVWSSKQESDLLFRVQQE